MSWERTSPDGYTEWFRNTCKGGRGADLVPLGHYIYDMCLVETPVNISPLPTRRKPKDEPQLTLLFLHLNQRRIPESVGSSVRAAVR